MILVAFGLEACVSLGVGTLPFDGTGAFFPSGWNRGSSFWCFSLLPRAPALGFELAAAVTPCVGLSEGFL